MTPYSTEKTENEDRIIPLYSLLPPQIRRKIKALKKLQFQTLQVNTQFYLDLHKLECKYANLNSDNFTRRAQIISGKVEPTPEECVFDEGYESPDDSSPAVQELRSKLGITRAIEAGAKGIPEFWLTALKNVELTSDLIQLHDEPILRHLIDISLIMSDDGPLGFTLIFHFSPNPYFSNLALTKEYEMNCSPDLESPWTFDGPEITNAKGCTIDWMQGMDVTHKTVQKKRKSKTKGSTNTVVKTVRNESFFNFFEPPKVPDPLPEGFPLDEVEAQLDIDFEVGSFIKEKLVPNAVLYYTGEALEDESSSEESGSESGSEDGAGDEIEDACASSSKSESEDAGSGDANTVYE